MRIAPGAPVWIREVLMSVDGVDSVPARSLTPLAASHGAWQGMRRLRTLADMFYHDRTVIRSPFACRRLARPCPFTPPPSALPPRRANSMPPASGRAARCSGARAGRCWWPSASARLLATGRRQTRAAAHAAPAHAALRPRLTRGLWRASRSASCPPPGTATRQQRQPHVRCVQRIEIRVASAPAQQQHRDRHAQHGADLARG